MFSKFKLKKLSTNAKKGILLGCMVALLVVTGVLSFVFNNKLDDGGGNIDAGINQPSNVEETFFSNYRATRETTRNSEIMVLDSIMASSEYSQETKLSAEQKRLDILETMEKEMVYENLIKAKGIKDAVVTLSENNVNVIIEKTDKYLEHGTLIISVFTANKTYTQDEVYIIPVEV